MANYVALADYRGILRPGLSLQQIQAGDRVDLNRLGLTPDEAQAQGLSLLEITPQIEPLLDLFARLPVKGAGNLNALLGARGFSSVGPTRPPLSVLDVGTMEATNATITFGRGAAAQSVDGFFESNSQIVGIIPDWSQPAEMLLDFPEASLTDPAGSLILVNRPITGLTLAQATLGGTSYTFNGVSMSFDTGPAGTAFFIFDLFVTYKVEDI